MPRFARSEVEQAFAHFYRLGPVDEQWGAWAKLFTDDCRYVEHFWGTLHGNREVEAWIHPVMAGVPEVYTVLEWYAIDDEKVIWSMQNRRDNPDPAGPPYFDFPGLSVAIYAGDGRWALEEDYWDVRGARETSKLYAEAVARSGATLEQRLTRRHWPAGPAWARSDRAPHPDWLDIPGVEPITKPRELREILARVRGR